MSFDNCSNCVGWLDDPPDYPNPLDVETTLLHELGHYAMALDHYDYTTVPPFGFATNFTQATHSQFPSGPGVDGVRGSSDDQRPPDGSNPPGNTSLFWYNADPSPAVHNVPTYVPEVVDGSTYDISRDDLLFNHMFPASLNVDVSREILGAGETEAVMLSRASRNRQARALAPDDVATVRLAMSGVDETQGTADDYTVRLEFSFTCSDSHIRVGFNPSQVAVGLCTAAGVTQLADNHYRMLTPPPGLFIAITLRTTFPGTGDPEVWDFGDQDIVFSDGFESGDTSAWSEVVP